MVDISIKICFTDDGKLKGGNFMPEGKWFLQYSMTMGVLEHDKVVKVKLDAANVEPATILGKRKWEKLKKEKILSPNEIRNPEVIQSFCIEE